MSDIVGIGATVYDTLMVTEGYPVEDTKMQAVRTVIQGGGPCATALVASARLGVSSEYLGAVGDDTYGAFMLEDFKRYGVGTGHIQVKKGYISFHSFVILNTVTSSRTCIWNRGTIPALMPEEINTDAIKAARVLHLDGHQLDAAVYAAQFARAHGVKVSLDAGGVYPGIERLLSLTDFLIPSEEFALKVSGETDTHKAAGFLFRQFKPEFVIVTRGSEGGLIFDGENYMEYPSFKVEAVDTNGAGDVFHGAFIAGYVKGMDAVKAAHFASAAAALKCTRVGARMGVPGYSETVEFLRRNGYAEL